VSPAVLRSGVPRQLRHFEGVVAPAITLGAAQHLLQIAEAYVVDNLKEIIVPVPGLYRRLSAANRSALTTAGSMIPT
jgi:hypothetical protein